jgi:DNA-binding phage protein
MMSVMNSYAIFLGSLTNMMKAFKGENSQFMATTVQMNTTTPEQIAKNSVQLQENFKEIASFLYNAFENTLSSSSGEGKRFFPEESRAKDVTDRIANMTKIVKDYGLMMQELISTIGLMSNLKTNGFDETKFTADFNAVSRFLWSAFEVTIGGNDKVGGYFPSGDRAKDVIERIANMGKIVKDYSSMMKDLSAAITNLSAIDIKDLDASKFNEKLNSLLSSLKVGGLDLQKSSPIAEIETIIKVYEGVYTSLSKLEKIMNDIANKMKSISGINFDMQKIKGMGLGMGENAGPLGLSNISAVVENGMEPQTATVVANTAPINQVSDVENKIMANKAGASMPTSKITSDELSDIASENEEQNAKLQTLIGLFKDVVDLLKPNSVTVANSNMTFGRNANSPKLPPPRFARAITGLPQSLPDKAVVNIGSNAII